jgi:FkbM family methyltransferase
LQHEDFLLTDPTTDPGGYGAFAPKGLVQSILSKTRAAGPDWLSRRTAFALRRIAIAKLRGDPVDTEALGARMRLFPYRNVCEKRILFTPQFFDPAELAALKARMRDGFVFLDIGANIGGYSLFVAANAGPSARVLAVEPQPDIYERLVYNLRLNPFPSVKAVACAVADKEGELTLFVDPENKGESSLKIMSEVANAGSIKVPAKRLLTLIEEQGFNHVDAAKLDTEGAEDIILETFFGEAPQHLWPKLLIMERGGNRWHVDMPKLLGFNGYRVVQETRNNLIYER